MKNASLHPSEEQRIEALKFVNILDTVQEQEFDEITLLASKYFDSPISVISFIDKERQWFKSKIGLSISETTRDVAFCAHTILQNDIFCVEDATKDDRFSDNPLVMNEPYVVFYAGITILDPQKNLPIGTLCVIDSKTKKISCDQFDILRILKNQVQRLISLRQNNISTNSIQSELINTLQQQNYLLEKVSFDSSDWMIKPNSTYFDIFEYEKREILQSKIQKLAKIGGWELDVLTQDLKWTEQTYNIFGVSHTVNMNMNMCMGFFPSDEKEKIKLFVQKCMCGAFNQQKIEFIDANGKKKWVELTGEPLYDSEKKIKIILGTIQDITDKIVAENEIALNRLKATQSAKLASIGEISVGVAHEINNPLAIIDGNLRLLSKCRNDESKFHSKIDIAVGAIQRIVRIVDGLRKFSRTTEIIVLKENYLSEIIREALVMIEPKLKMFSIQLEMDIETDGLIICDFIEIEQVIINLLSNAIDAVKFLEDRWVKIKLFIENGDIVLHIVDSGPGILPEVEANIFNPFFTTKPIGEGTGIGLSICKGIIDHHKAVIKLNRNYSNTCFELRFNQVNSVNNEAA